MGWSCGQKAGMQLRHLQDQCFQQTGTTNVFETNSKRYMFEISNTEHGCGAITGTIFRYLEDGVHVRRSGSIRIEGDGSITRAPKWLKDRSLTPKQIQQEVDRIKMQSRPINQQKYTFQVI